MRQPAQQATFGFARASTSTSPLIHFILYRIRLIIPSVQLWQLLGFCLLALLPYRRSSPSCIGPLFFIIVFSSVAPSPVSFSIFPRPLVLRLFRILLLRVSGLLLSFRIARILFLPLLSSIPSIWSRFHIWNLLMLFCPSTSSSLLSIFVFFGDFSMVFVTFGFPYPFCPLFCFPLSSVICSTVVLARISDIRIYKVEILADGRGVNKFTTK